MWPLARGVLTLAVKLLSDLDLDGLLKRIARAFFFTSDMSFLPGLDEELKGCLDLAYMVAL